MWKKIIQIMLLLIIVSGNTVLAIGVSELVEVTRKAESGDVKAQIALANHYRISNESVSLMWYERAAGQGDAVYQFIYATESHCNSIEKRVMLQRSAEQGFLPAMIELADFYTDSHYYRYNHKEYKIEPNYTEAVRWYQKAIDAGDEQSSYKLGLIYLQEDGVPKDIERAKSLLQKTADGRDYLQRQNMK